MSSTLKVLVVDDQPAVRTALQMLFEVHGIPSLIASSPDEVLDLMVRVTDPSGHPGMISGPGVATVLIGGLPAAVMGDLHACAMPSPAGPHPPSPFPKGSTNVLIGGRGALRMGDISGCGAPIVMGHPTVEIGG